MWSPLSVEVTTISLFALFVRWLISMNPYSGAGKPPMYGDFEAQRHWMEITFNLPIQKWYVNSTDNDLLYWGLDYPPLTAYHSWVCGYIANKIDSSWVALFSSRGIETFDHKVFMRATVLVADILIFIPAVFAFFNKCCDGHTQRKKFGMILLTLTYPGILLIDHGHFQYNCVSLGLLLWVVTAIMRGQDCLGAVCFVLALNYKQMELYHALPIFCYLLGVCFRGQELWLWKLIKIGVVTVATFALCWLPFLEDTSTVIPVLQRIFPFNRGLYEDKVANFWCSLSVLIKLKNIMDTEKLVKLCLATTSVALLPSSLNLLWRPTKLKFKIALVNSSLAFFLFSFHVHEKSILLAAIPVCALLPQFPFEAVWFLLISTFSMVPLLVKDSLLLPFVAASALFYVTASLTLGEDELIPSPQHRSAKTPKLVERKSTFWPRTAVFLLFCLSILGFIALTVASLLIEPPQNLPDIFPVLISAYSCGHLMLFFLYFNLKQFTFTESLRKEKPSSKKE